MRKTLKELTEIIGGEIVGDPLVLIKGVAPLEEAKEGDITFFANSKLSRFLHKTKASAVIVDAKTPGNGKPLIRIENPYAAFSKIMELWVQNKTYALGIHPTAVLGEQVRLGENVSIGAYAVIEDHVEIGDGTIIQPHTYIGESSKIGKNCHVYPQVTIAEKVEITDNVVIHSGTVIGSEGFGFIGENGTYRKIPQIGKVIIGSNVQIGANVTIDRATFGKTWIKDGTKIDNLVQIAHNVEIGKNCIIVGQVGICGSVKIGDGVILAGQVGIVDHLSIGDGAKVAAKSVVTKSVPAGKFVSGYPARDHNEEKRIKASIARLPLFLKKVQEISKKLEKYEKKS
ncbi:MAG: UDP-3-O-(3-hydroxymyristoyl)glucosamine N-acyltransferase [Candidatus Ratteibacteria bacterium]|nr:UDP-3-O-(3-hydroxymyristoyl)glucosamine N-acyltransferase [Candidatus Ratteibacteria bacterium]